MKHSLIVFLSALSLAAAGCGGPTKKDIEDSEARLNTKITQSSADLEKKINGIDSKYASMLALEQEVKNGLQRIDQNAKLLEGANDVDSKMLQAHRNSLREELKSIEDQLAVLQKTDIK
jgi:hypothetical protein